MADFDVLKEKGKDMRINSAVDKAAGLLGYSEVNELQWNVIFEAIKGRDVFAVLPTGYGKSLCYGCSF